MPLSAYRYYAAIGPLSIADSLPTSDGGCRTASARRAVADSPAHQSQCAPHRVPAGRRSIRFSHLVDLLRCMLCHCIWSNFAISACWEVSSYIYNVLEVICWLDIDCICLGSCNICCQNAPANGRSLDRYANVYCEYGEYCNAWQSAVTIIRSRNVTVTSCLDSRVANKLDNR